jgi:antitoxin component YwqK of YwqJK toxin-antitoxin module
MKYLLQMLVSAALSASLGSSVIAWDKTVLDTVEVRFPDSTLKEQYQTMFWGGDETTGKFGFYRTWYPNGQIEWDGQYHSNAKVGTWVHQDSTGHRIEEFSYLAGKEHGRAIVWSDDGVGRNILNYRNGKLHGLSTWRQAGDLAGSVFQDEDLVIDSEFVFLDGEMLVAIKVGKTNEYVPSCWDSQSPFYNAKLDLWVEWKMKECVFMIGRKVDGKRQGLWRAFSRNGDLERVDYYDGGVVKDSL